MANFQTFQFQSNTLSAYPLKASNFGEGLIKLDRGTYTVLRIYPGLKVLRLKLHLERLKQSTLLFGSPFEITESTLRTAVHQAVEVSRIFQPRICVLVPFSKSNRMVLMVEDFTPPSEEQYQEGIRAGITKNRRKRPGIKDTSFIPKRQEIRKNNPQFHEMLIENEKGNLLEGLTSNFFAVIDRKLKTAGNDVLDGISRQILLSVAPEIIPVVLTPPSINDRSTMSEAFLTSTSRGVLPVVEIDGIQITDGIPGPITAALSARFNAKIEEELEPL